MTTPEPPYPYEWRYTSNQGARRHLVNVAQHHSSTVCGIQHWGYEDFMGTGSQREIERLASLPDCKSCVKKVFRAS